MSNPKRVGGCQCGAVRYEARGEPIATAICHCVMCRRASAASAVGWMLFNEAEVSFTKGELRQFASSAEARRGFCADCGTPISFTGSFMPGLIDLIACSLDDPESVTPEMHIWHSRHLSWGEFADKLPRLPEAAPQS